MNTTILPQIEALISEQINPILALHSGECKVSSFSSEDQTLKIVLLGGCVGCPSSRITLYNGIIPILEEAFPNVQVIVEDL